MLDRFSVSRFSIGYQPMFALFVADGIRRVARQRRSCRADRRGTAGRLRRLHLPGADRRAQRGRAVARRRAGGRPTTSTRGANSSSSATP